MIKKYIRKSVLKFKVIVEFKDVPFEFAEGVLDSNVICEIDFKAIPNDIAVSILMYFIVIVLL